MVIDLVELVKEGNTVRGVQVIGFYDRDVILPEHLHKYNMSEGNKATMVDIIGVVIKGQTYHAKGQCFAVLGYNTAVAGPSGKRMILIEGTLSGGKGNYVELTTKFQRKSDNALNLYATKTLMRDGSVLKEAYPEFVTIGLRAYDKDTGAWDFDKAFEKTGIEFPEDYKKACGVGVISELGDGSKYQPRGLNLGNQGTNNKRELENRGKIRRLPEKYKGIQDVTLKAREQVRKELGKHLEKTDEQESDIQDRIDYTSRQIRRFWRAGSSEVENRETGRALIKRAISVAFPKMAEDYTGGQLIVDSILQEDTVKSWGKGENLTNNKYVEIIVMEREKLYIGLLDTIMGMRGKLVRLYSKGKAVEIDIYKLIQDNPYLTTLIDSRLTLTELEKLTRLYNIDREREDIKMYKNVAYMHNKILDSNDVTMGENTIKRLKSIEKDTRSGLEVTKRELDSIQECGMILSEREYDIMRLFINPDIGREQFKVRKQGWVKVRQKYVQIEREGVEVIKDYLGSGVGVLYNIDGEAYITDIVYAQKEMDIVDKMYDISKNGRNLGLEYEDIEQSINRFERLQEIETGIQGFKLEARQREAVHLINEPVMCLTGSAGSGKTTTAEAILYVLEDLAGYTKDSLVACAPTGKAADRLKEVIKKPARTIHSTFRIGEIESDVVTESSESRDREDVEILLVDEASMISLNLMYELLQKIDTRTRVIIIGDREQLPPIDAGKPYANLLNYLPTVVLNVSKRAKDGSGITSNATKIILESDGRVEPLEQTDDFRMIKVEVDETLKIIQGIVAYHMSGGEVRKTGKTLHSVGTNLKPDDIQIITPVNNYNWGTKYLNREVQELFNPKKENQKSYRVLKGYITETIDGERQSRQHFVEFRVGDRVIHLENQHKRERIDKEGSIYRLREDEGIMNGAVGEIVGVVHSNEVEIQVPEGLAEEKTDEEKKSIKDKYKGGRNTYLMEVKYEDIDKDGITSEFIIFYPFDDTTADPGARVRDVRGGSITQIDLAYALTVHKTQGSQASVVIMIVHNVYGDFISRNLIYTGVTRAVDGVYLIGDVIGNNSMLARGRQVEQNMRRETIGDRIFE